MVGVATGRVKGPRSFPRRVRSAVREDGRVAIDDVLPAGAVGAEAWGPWDEVRLASAEDAAVAGAGEQRRAEFAAGRDCARRALRRLGWPDSDVAVGRNDDGSPRWPVSIVGSITHTDRYAAAAVARRADLVAIGIDAEAAEPLPVGVATLVFSAEEAAWAGAHPGGPWDRVLFSAKESAAKAWAAASGRLHDLSEVEVGIDPATGTFSARIVGTPATTRALEGRFAWGGGLVLTAVGLPAR
jgi:4'-phosphopantetheinyl transferase EntD